MIPCASRLFHLTLVIPDKLYRCFLVLICYMLEGKKQILELWLFFTLCITTTSSRRLATE
jgi:hypothetical protein